MDNVLIDSFERLLSDISTPQTVRKIEAGESWQPLWHRIFDSGFLDALVREEDGGAGLTLHEAFALWFQCGRHSLPLPVADTMLVRAAYEGCGVDVPDGPVVISPLPVTHESHPLDCRNVPFGKLAQWVLVLHIGPTDQQSTLLLPVDKAELTETGVNGSLQAHLRWNEPERDGIALETELPWHELAALVTATLMAGAMSSVLDITVKYAGERSQFGRPIGKFQAVQQQLSVLAELASASRMAAELGCRGETSSAENKLAPNILAACVAKARASEAAEAVVKIAHAVHAAMGVTAEYDLQLHTRRLIEWRTDYGSASYWNRRVGDAVLASDAPTTLEFMLPTFFPETASARNTMPSKKDTRRTT